MIPEHPERIDYEYVRNGTCNILMAVEPLGGRRFVEASKTKTAADWARFSEKFIAAYPEAEKIILIQDNLNTHKAASWYANFPPERAKALMDKVEFIYTPKHGSWLNIAEIELNVLSGQCLKRHIGDIETMAKEVAAWTKNRNNLNRTIDWQFTTENARINPTSALYCLFEATVTQQSFNICRLKRIFELKEKIREAIFELKEKFFNFLCAEVGLGFPSINQITANGRQIIQGAEVIQVNFTAVLEAEILKESRPSLMSQPECHKALAF